ncbi:MAG: TrmH family RNA methyltransferase, partial [Pseudomonadota bacterium]|nr:TrmH family RNA methyltransferase [Pseudomonadota bacterium]
MALYQPDIPQNTGSIIRLAACFGFTLHIIEPAGFVIDDKRLKRVAMDYLEYLELVRHESWDKFYSWSRSQSKRIILATTKASQSYLDIKYQTSDIIVFGRESSGVPDAVHEK